MDGRQELAAQDLIVFEGDTQAGRKQQPQLLAASYVGCGYDLEIAFLSNCDDRLLSKQGI